MENPTKKLLSIGEAAEFLGISIDTLRRWDAQEKLKPALVSEGKHRYYDRSTLALLSESLFIKAESWAAADLPVPPPETFHCRMKPGFQSQLDRMQDIIRSKPELAERYSLIVAAAAEIGNNSFDHNIGNWPDIQGLYFGHDPNKRWIALADRGRGVLTTLRAARPGLKNDEEALKMAFTEIVTGRAPENRGNGLKFVRSVIMEYPMCLRFFSGNAEARISQGSDLTIVPSASAARGCVALLTY